MHPVGKNSVVHKYEPGLKPHMVPQETVISDEGSISDEDTEPQKKEKPRDKQMVNIEEDIADSFLVTVSDDDEVDKDDQ